MASQYKIALVIASLGLILASQVDAFEPLVETGTSKVAPEGRHVAVHVPGFFNMVLDTRGLGKGLRMSQSVMLGLVNIFIDRERTSDGSLKGPIRVKVGGLTMYNNGESDLRSSAGIESQLNEIAANQSSNLGELGSELREEANKAREQLRGQTSQLSGRFSSLLGSRTSGVKSA